MPQTQDESTHDEQRNNNNGENGTPTATNQQPKQEIMLELRKYILLLASLVATVTYAAEFNPPGDVWQDTAADHIAGDPIIRDTHHKRYVAFFYCNATAFAASLVVIVLVLILASLDDKETSSTNWIVSQYKSHPRLAVRPLQLVMVVDLLSLMGAYAAGTCRDTFTTVYSSVLVGFVFFYVVIQVAVASCSCSCFNGTGSDGVLMACCTGANPSSFLPKKVLMAALAPVPGNNLQSSSGSMPSKVEQDKAQERFRKVLMLLATFAVSITYVAGLSRPGGFWDTADPGHLPGDAILKDRHNRRLAVFFVFNTLAFVASLLRTHGFFHSHCVASLGDE